MARRPTAITVRGTLKATPRRAPTSTDDRWYWQVYYNHGGKQHKVHGLQSGRYTRRELKALLQAAWDGGDWASHNREPTPSPTTGSTDSIDNLLAGYLGHQRDRCGRGRLAEGTLETQEHTVQRLRRYPELVGLPVSQAPSVRVLQRLADALAEDYAPSTMAQTWTLLRQAWGWGQTYYPTVVREALPPVELPADDAQQYTPTLDELLAVRDQLRGWHRRAYVCLMATGARGHEIGELTWEQVDWQRETVRLLGKGKGGGVKAPRLLPLSPTLADALREQWVARGQPDHGRVWQSVKAREALRRATRRGCAAAEVPTHTPHGIRRWMACELLERVFSPTPFSAADYEAWMGHTLEVGLRIYASARPGRLEGAAEAVEALLASNVIEIRRKG